MGASTCCASRCHSQQAERWSSPTIISGGASTLHRSTANRQRGWKAHPGGMCTRSGGNPSMGSSLAFRGWSNLGTERSSPRV